ncbi:MAG: NAD(P)/FAD-dependent oxidoreductase [Bryobacteraceae bacterium]
MRYAIVGNGVAGVTAALGLRARDAHASITLISGEADYFFSRTALMYAFLDRLSRRDLEPYERGVFEAQRIELVRGWVKDLDAQTRTLTLDSGRTLGWDRLLIATGSRPRRPQWEGLESVREGQVHFVSMQDLEACERAVRRGAKAVVVGGGLIGIELVECLHWAGMEVSFLIREPWYWPVALSDAESAMVIAHLRRHGVNVVTGETVTAVAADDSGVVTGVLTEASRRYECRLLGVSIGVEPAVEWLRAVTTPPRLMRGIVVDAGFRTSLPDVFAAGDCAEVELSGRAAVVEQLWYSAKRQGGLAAQAMLGDAVHYEPPIFFNSSRFFEIEYTAVGRFSEAMREFYHRFEGRDASLRLGEENGAVKACNMLGSRWDHKVLEGWVREHRSLEDVMSRLDEAQFDVEFGRLNLAPARAAFEHWRRAESAAGKAPA